ncbi:hypothetical protein BDK51DRAFT_37853 [Blyttiomyces helicus]|uniref:Ankyrin repeat-containing domain protein n=1 Tax=Blyttiomyces helicus TaxID=388810 RepID=A0A4P9W5A5_9FUNG|nr:hypothetical protein BDK51DRAFT_37853 [Blyttiomyces helicus]|eukprot:RKO87132.1 hypothetical protein BDK51DRAFT_37853 [Blyttiomyces helicus]
MSTRPRWDCLSKCPQLTVFGKGENPDRENEEEESDEDMVEEHGRSLRDFLVAAGFSTARAVDHACEYRASLNDIRYLFSLEHDGVSTDRAILHAARAVDIPLVRLLYHHHVTAADGEAIAAACHINSPDMVACLLELSAPVYRRQRDIAAGNGDLAVVKLLHEKVHENAFTTNAMDVAAVCSLEVVRFLHESRTEGCTVQAMKNAADAGWLDIVQFLHDHWSEGCTTDVLDMDVASWTHAASYVPPWIFTAEVVGHERQEARFPAGEGGSPALQGGRSIPQPTSPRASPPGRCHSRASTAASSLFEARTRLSDDEAARMLSQRLGDDEAHNVEAFLREMHGLDQSEGHAPLLTHPPPLPAPGRPLKYARPLRLREASTEASDERGRVLADVVLCCRAGGIVVCFCWVGGAFRLGELALGQAERIKEVVLFLNRHRTESFTTAAMSTACKHRCIKLVRFLLANVPETASANAVKAAFAAGDAEIMRILYKAGMRLSDTDVARLLSRQSGYDEAHDVKAFLRELHGVDERGGNNSLEGAYIKGVGRPLPLAYSFHSPSRAPGRRLKHARPLRDIHRKQETNVTGVCGMCWVNALFVLSLGGYHHLVLLI